jgi:hypothetical protein
MNGFLKHRSLAQQLLCSLVPMLVSGCLWPTSLTDAVSNTQHVHPVFTMADPPFGVIDTSPGTPTPLHLWAEDPDVDLLYMRMFKLATTNAMRVYDRDLYPSKDPKTDVFTANVLPALDLCGLYGDGTELFVIVSDAAFNDTGIGDQSNGLSNENHWQVKCQ